MANKRKKHHTGSSLSAKQKADAAAVADLKDRARRRMNPIARNILLGDLVFMAATAMMEEQEIIAKSLSNFFAVIGMVLVIVALYFQFIKKDGGPKSGPRLK